MLSIVETPSPSIVGRDYVQKAIVATARKGRAAHSTYKMLEGLVPLSPDYVMEDVATARGLLEYWGGVAERDNVHIPDSILYSKADVCDVFVDFGFTASMLMGLVAARRHGIPVTVNYLHRAEPSTEAFAAALGLTHACYLEEEEEKEKKEEEEEE